MSAPASNHKSELGSFLNSLLPHFVRAMIRFPLPVLFCVLFSAHNFMGDQFQSGLPGLLSEQLGWLLGLSFLWTLIVAVWVESGKKPRSEFVLATVFGLGMILVLIAATKVLHTSAFLLILTMVLVLGLAAHHKPEQQNDTFWQYNQTLWLGAVVSVLGVFTLATIPLAVVGLVEYLFALPLPVGIYAKILTTAIVLIAPLFWLTLIPDDYNAPPKLFARSRSGTSQIANYHSHTDTNAIVSNSSTRLIVSYVLVPLMIINTLVLYRYGFKIWLDGAMPPGRLGPVVLAYTGVGLVSYLMCYPFRCEGGILIRFYWRSWFIASVIPAALLLLAVAIRVEAYGLSEARYLMGLIAIWHLGLSIGFVVFRISDLRFIPAALAALLIIGAVGPPGATGASIRSQQAQLATILFNNGRLHDGQLRANGAAIGLLQSDLQSKTGANDAQRIKSILSYLGERDALDAVEPWVSKLRDNPFLAANAPNGEPSSGARSRSDQQGKQNHELVAKLARLMGAPFSPIGSAAARTVVFYARNPALVALKDTARLAGPINLSLNQNGNRAVIKVAPGTGRDLAVVLSERGLTVTDKRGRMAYFDLSIAARSIAWFEDKRAVVPALTSPRIVRPVRGDLKVRLVLTSLQGQRTGRGHYAFKQISCWLLLYKK